MKIMINSCAIAHSMSIPIFFMFKSSSFKNSERKKEKDKHGTQKSFESNIILNMKGSTVIYGVTKTMVPGK